MEATTFTATVKCEIPLTEADLRFLERHIAAQLNAVLVQKNPTIEFERDEQ